MTSNTTLYNLTENLIGYLAILFLHLGNTLLCYYSLLFWHSLVGHWTPERCKSRSGGRDFYYKIISIQTYDKANQPNIMTRRIHCYYCREEHLPSNFWKFNFPYAQKQHFHKGSNYFYNKIYEHNCSSEKKNFLCQIIAVELCGWFQILE